MIIGVPREDAALARGVNVIHGTIANRGVAEAMGLPYTAIH